MQSNAKSLVLNNRAKEGEEVLDWMLYDSLFTTANTAQQLIFFQNTLGAVGRNRTNMKNAGMLPSPQKFVVNQIMFKFFNVTGASFTATSAGAGAAVIYPINAMISRANFDVVLEPATVYEGHLSSMYEQLNYLMDAPASLLGTALSPTAFYYKTLKLRYPIIIDSNRSFAVRLNITTPAEAGGYTAANTLIMVYMMGDMLRNR